MLKKPIKDRILYVMNYSLEKTPKENLLEQATPNPTQEPPKKFVQLPDALKVTPKTTSMDKEWYQSGCKYPKMAVPPPKIASYPELEDEDYKISGFCAYRVTKDEANYFPSETEIIFSTNESVNKFWKNAKKTWKKYFDNAPKETIEVLEKQFKDKFNEGTVVAFTPPGGEQFVRTISLKNYKNLINAEFTLGKYCTRGTDGPTNNCYDFKVWVDTREPWKKFLDNWEFLLNTAGIAVVMLANVLVPEIAFPIELIVFTCLGGTYGYRSWTKGDNIGVGVNLLFSLLPYLRMFKWYQGIPKSVWMSLSEKASKYNLLENPQEYFKLVEELNEAEKKALNIISRQDPNVLGKSLQKVMKDNKQSLSILTELLEDKGTSPKELLRFIPFWKRLWVKDLSVIGIIEILKFSLQLCCNKTLNDEESVREVFVDLPKNTQEYLLYQMANNPNTIDNIILEVKKEQEKIKKQGVNIDYWKKEKNLQDSLKRAGATIYPYEN